MELRIRLSGPQGHEADIIAFRQGIMRAIHMDPQGPAAQPLPYGAYLFCSVEGEQQPVAMGELYVYTQRFADFSRVPYCEAYDLSQLGPLEQFIHLRSFFVAPGLRRASLVYALMSCALMRVSLDLGTTLMTAGTHSENAYNIRLFERTGLKQLGYYTVEGQRHILMYLDIPCGIAAPMMDRVRPHMERILEADAATIARIRDKRA